MSRNKIVSVICEYNPFHFGHAFQLKKLKESFDCVVCIQSGDIVQRGSVAVADKYLRAEAAMKNGADLVLELPIPYSCSSARDFAFAGVHIAKSICSDYLAFSAEDDIELLNKIYSLTSRNDFEEMVQSLVRSDKNLSFPLAMTEIIKKELGEIAADAIKKPNNILSLEYLKSLEGSSVLPFTVKRNQEFASSSKIRSLNDGEKMVNALPEASANVFNRVLGTRFPRDERKLDAFFVGSLRRIAQCDSLPENLYSTPKDLAKKILFASIKYSSIDSIVIAVADKNYTRARVRRAINSIVFGITTDKVAQNPPYTTVLAVNEIGREILRHVKKNDQIDIINKPVRALELGEKTKNAFLFAKGIEDIISLSDPTPLPADTGKNPFIGEPLSL